MRLRKLTIRTLPGIETGFTFKPTGAGVNLVVGPNAIGKSSLARALKFLLGSRKDDPPALSLEAEFDDGASRWRVVRNGSQIAWQCGGATASRPALPAAEQGNGYHLSVESLLAHDDAGDQELAARLRRELLGGCDLDALRSAIQTPISSRFGKAQAKNLDAAATAQRQVASAYRTLREEEKTLPGLEQQIEAALDAGRQRERLEQALKLARAIDARRRCEEQLKRFSPAMAGLQGDEADLLAGHGKKQQELRELLRARKQEREAAAAALERSGLAQDAPAGEKVQAIDAKLRALEGWETERGKARQDAAQAEAAAHVAREQLGGGTEPTRIDADACRNAEDIASLLIGARKRLAELQEQLELAGEPPDEVELERHLDAAAALRDWLATAGAEPSRWPLLATGVLAAGAALAAYLQDAPVAAATALAALLAAGAVFWLARRHTSATENRFGATKLDPPQRWDDESVRQRLREVETASNKLTLQRDRAAQADQIKVKIKAAQTELEELESRRQTLAAEIGFDPNLPAVAFDRFVRLSAAWDQARVQHAEKLALVTQRDREIVGAAREVRAFLDAWPAVGGADDGGDGSEGDAEVAEAPPDLDLLRTTFERLEARVVKANTARSEIRGSEQAIDSVSQQIADVETAVRQVYARAGVEPGDRSALNERLEQWPDWLKAKKALDESATGERLAREALKDQSDLIERAEAGEHAQLQAERDDAADKADRYTELIRQQQDIRTRLDEAGHDRKLELAAADADRARQALEDRREEALLAEATAVLLDDVEQAFKSEHEPDILRRAREIFAAVTAHDFELHLSADGKFSARDTRQGAVRELGELSSGTRMQLLLALRLAWIEAQERGGATLPLFLDEALTTSDWERFAEMAKSLEQIAAAEDGRQRQVFYLTARRDEAALWRHATGSEPPLIDLAAVRSKAQTAGPEHLAAPDQPRPPTPRNGETAEDYYSRLGVPRFDPRLPPDGMHLFYLLQDDLPRLHALMDSWRISALGPLEGLLASDAAVAAAGSAEACNRLRLRCKTAHKWTDLWRQGRGRPVDRGVLEQCSAVSARFIDRVAELAGHVEGDGQALVRALRGGRLPHFHTTKADDLEQWLVDEHYIDRRPRLNAAERRRLTLERVAPATEAEARDVNQVIDWLEAAAAWLEPAGDASA